MWSMIIVLIGLYHDHVCKKKRKDPSGYTRHLTARSRSTISNWCRRLQAACARALSPFHTHWIVYFLLFVCASRLCVYIYIFVCKNSRSNRNKKAMMTNCWPFILHNSECQWHTYGRAVRRRESKSLQGWWVIR
jgi:hypothetical protein